MSSEFGLPFTPADSELKARYTAMAVTGLAEINEFQPEGAIGVADLIESYPDEEPDSYESMLQLNLLAEIGVPKLDVKAVISGAASSSEVFVYNNAISRYVMLERAEGKEPVGLHVVYEFNSETQSIGCLRLLQIKSNEAWHEGIAVEKRPALEAQATKDLSDKFGIGVEFIRKSGLTLEDMQGFLEASAYLESTPVILPDMSNITSLRDRLIKTMIQPSKKFHSSQGFKAISLEYLESLRSVLNDPEIDDTTRTMLSTNEQLLRLASISQQLPERFKRVDRSQAISSALWTTALTGLGTLYGYTNEQLPAPPPGPEIYTLKGMLIGVALSGVYLVASNKKYLSGRKYVQNIEQGMRRGGPVDDQLRREYGYINRNNKVEHL
jgi:hypothetical protein